MPAGSGCQPLKEYHRLTVAEHGRLAGRHAMKAEIYKRGPISCVIMATEKLYAFNTCSQTTVKHIPHLKETLMHVAP